MLAQRVAGVVKPAAKLEMLLAAIPPDEIIRRSRDLLLHVLVDDCGGCARCASIPRAKPPAPVGRSLLS